MKKTIGILAHVDAGKTTFSEQLLFEAGAIRRAGRVDHRDTFLDSHPIEKERGITVFSEQTVFSYKGDTYYLVDTPGHADFAGEAERSMRILDFAILLISGVEGIQSHTGVLWKVLKELNIPVVFFINKTDRAGADLEGVLKQIKSRFTADIVRMDGVSKEEIPEAVYEEAAALEEELLERYLERGCEREPFIEAVSRMLSRRQVFPVFSGSALNGIGIQEFLSLFHEITKTDYEKRTGEFQAQIYKVHNEKGVRLSFLKLLNGSLKAKQTLCTGIGPDGEPVMEKVDELRMYRGMKFESVKEVQAGDVCGVAGLYGTKAGGRIGAADVPFACAPLLCAKVLYPETQTAKQMLEYFRILEDEDPLLSVAYQEEAEQIQVRLMGVIQMEILRQVVRERFGVSVEFGEPEILYQETLSAPVLGKGHFEPLRHYAEVCLRLAPGARGSGITFRSVCHQDELSMAFQNLIRTHVFEKQHRGVLLGAPLTDVEITLVKGRAHLKHTEGGDFREAVYRGIRQGLMKGKSLILEPFYRFRIDAAPEDLGKILSDIERLHGSFDPPGAQGGQMVITGRAPAATFMNYGKDLVRITGGRGQLTLEFGGYDLCHNPEAVMEVRGYDPERDRENTADSVFCSHGAGFLVKWQDADRYMHLKVEETS